MLRYSSSLIEKARKLRHLGHTYSEIRTSLDISIPKSTLSEWCSKVILPKEYVEKVARLNLASLSKGRRVALAVNAVRREKLFNEIRVKNLPIARRIDQDDLAKVALAMLCLGEASKYNPKIRRTFSLGSSDPRIIVLFLELIKQCFPFDMKKVRCTVQCRADQDPEELKRYWLSVTGVSKSLFYKPLIDPRTIGKPTKKKNYKGVLRVDYFDTKVQLDLESLADLVYNEVHSRACGIPVTRFHGMKE